MSPPLAAEHEPIMLRHPERHVKIWKRPSSNRLPYCETIQILTNYPNYNTLRTQSHLLIIPGPTAVFLCAKWHLIEEYLVPKVPGNLVEFLEPQPVAQGVVAGGSAISQVVRLVQCCHLDFGRRLDL